MISFFGDPESKVFVLETNDKLDNFSIEDVSEATSKIRQISDIEIEISGGINLDNIAGYAPYADFISMSSLTMSAPPVDFSLHVI